jgi:hypothetical protein
MVISSVEEPLPGKGKAFSSVLTVHKETDTLSRHTPGIWSKMRKYHFTNYVMFTHRLQQNANQYLALFIVEITHLNLKLWD